jgi:hypothetical protein
MALTFPSSPTDGQLYVDTVTGNRYIYDSGKGLWKYASNNVGMTVGTAPPPATSANPGAMWYNTNTGRTFILYDDGDSKQWVENVPAVGSFDSSTVAGYANAAVLPAVTPAFNKANTALQNTTGTFAGSLTATGDVTSGGTITALSTVQSSSGADLSLNANGANRDVIAKVNGTELARVVGSTGRVGIGTSSPATKLDVAGSITANGYLYVTASDAGNEGGEIQLNGAGNYAGWSLDSYQNNYRTFVRTGSTLANVTYFHALGGSVRIGINKTDPLYALDVAGTINATSDITSGGKLRSSATSQNYAVSSATAVTVSSATPTTIASVTITTTGKPVLLIGTGDCNPNAGGDWNYIGIYRDSTRVGKLIINQTSGASYNNPFGITHIDTPGAGTYTYTLKANQGSGTITYGETGNDQAPTIVAVELI